MTCDQIAVRDDNRHSESSPDGRLPDVGPRLSDGTVLAPGDIRARAGPESPMHESGTTSEFHTMSVAMSPARAEAIWGMRHRLMEQKVKFSELLAPKQDAAGVRA